VAWLVQPAGVVAVSATFRSVVFPLLVNVAVAVVASPEVSVGSVCCPGAVLVTCTPTAGLADLAEPDQHLPAARSRVTVCVPAS